MIFLFVKVRKYRSPYKVLKLLGFTGSPASGVERKSHSAPDDYLVHEELQR